MFSRDLDRIIHECLKAIFSVAMILSFWLPVDAANYPSRPITIVVPFAPGGNVDITARILAKSLSKNLDQSIVVENKSGASGIIGSAYVSRARPDGYTLMVGSTATNATAPALLKAGYDPVNGFTILGGITETPSVIVVPANSPIHNYKELLEASKANSSGLNMGSPGVGSLNHLTTELLVQKTGLNAHNVPYKGSGPALVDLVGDHLDAMVDQLSSSISLIRGGKLRAIAQTGTSRSALLPDVPTLREQGVRGADVAVYTGFFAPKGLPKGVETKLVEALQEALKDPGLVRQYSQQGAEVITGGRAKFASHVAEEFQRWSAIIQKIGLKVQ